MKDLLVVAECVDLRTGERLMPGQVFPAGAALDQVERLTRSGCIREADLAAAPPLVAEAVLASGAMRAAEKDVAEVKAEAGRIAHGEPAEDEIAAHGARGRRGR